MSVAKHNPYAAALSHGLFKSKKVQSKKGKGSYNRKGKYKPFGRN